VAQIRELRLQPAVEVADRSFQNASPEGYAIIGDYLNAACVEAFQETAAMLRQQFKIRSSHSHQQPAPILRAANNLPDNCRYRFPIRSQLSDNLHNGLEHDFRADFSQARDILVQTAAGGTNEGSHGFQLRGMLLLHIGISAFAAIAQSLLAGLTPHVLEFLA
jgi:hypothetical protein